MSIESINRESSGGEQNSQKTLAQKLNEISTHHSLNAVLYSFNHHQYREIKQASKE